MKKVSLNYKLKIGLMANFFSKLRRKCCNSLKILQYFPLNGKATRKLMNSWKTILKKDIPKNKLAKFELNSIHLSFYKNKLLIFIFCLIFKILKFEFWRDPNCLLNVSKSLENILQHEWKTILHPLAPLWWQLARTDNLFFNLAMLSL